MEAFGEGLKKLRKMLLEPKYKGHLLCSDEKLGNAITYGNDENRKSTQWNCGFLETFEISSFNWLLLAAYYEI